MSLIISKTLGKCPCLQTPQNPGGGGEGSGRTQGQAKIKECCTNCSKKIQRKYKVKACSRWYNFAYNFLGLPMDPRNWAAEEILQHKTQNTKYAAIDLSQFLIPKPCTNITFCRKENLAQQNLSCSAHTEATVPARDLVLISI